MTSDDQRLIDIYAFMKAALELCQVEVIKTRELSGNKEILEITEKMSYMWGTNWKNFRETWAIPDCPLVNEED